MPRLPSNRFLVALLLLLPVVWALPANAFPFFNFKPKDQLTGAPPLPAPVTISVNRKQVVQIPLRVLGPQPEPVRFIIRTPPKHGTATLLTTNPTSEAIVEYRPPEDKSITREEFGFAAANSKGYSSETPVVIKIIDKAGRIELPSRIEFPKARVGATIQQGLRLKNSGDATVSGTFSASAPWQVDRESYELLPQEELTVQISLLPSASGSLQGEFRLSHDPDHPVQLRALVDEWIQAAPDPLKLSAPPSSKDRIGTLHIKNDGTLPETIRLESEPPLTHPPKITLQPGASEDVSFKTSQLQSEPFGGTLHLIREDSSGAPTATQRLLLWQAEAIGPILRIQANLAFPAIVPEDPHLFTPITFQNEGGREGTWKIQCTPPFTTDSSLIRLLPGKSIDLHVSVTQRPSEPNTGALKLTGAGQAIEIPLVVTPAAPLAFLPAERPKYTIQRPPASFGGSPQPQPAPSFSTGVIPKPLLLPSSSNNPSNPQATPQNLDPEFVALTKKSFLPGLALKGSKLRDITDHSAVLEVPLGDDVPAEALLTQILHLKTDPDNNLQVQWDIAPNLRLVRSKKGRVEFRFTKLEPATTYTFRILSPPTKNGRRVALHQCDITTLDRSRWFNATTVSLTVLGGVTLLFLRRRHIRNKRGW